MDVMIRALRFKGYEVVWAGDGQQGLAQYAAERPDLLLVDINLPDMSGLDIVRRLRAEESAEKRLGMIAVTANAAPSDRQAALLAGCDAFVTKPVDLPTLFDLIQQLLTKPV